MPPPYSPDEILYVDDDSISRMIATRTIAAVNGRVRLVCQSSVRKAFDYLDEKAQQGGFPQVILLDILMPVTTGHDFLCEFSERYALAFPHTSVFILSNSTHPKDIQEASEYPFMQGYFFKPIQKENVAEAVGAMSEDV